MREEYNSERALCIAIALQCSVLTPALEVTYMQSVKLDASHVLHIYELNAVASSHKSSYLSLA